MVINRRSFVAHSGQAMLAQLAPRLPHHLLIASQDKQSASLFDWSTNGLQFRFGVVEGRLRQFRLTPANSAPPFESCGVETAIQCDGYNSPDQGMKVGVGRPGLDLLFTGKHEYELTEGKRLVLDQYETSTGLQVRSFYQGIQGCSVIRRWTRLINGGSRPVGIQYISSGMLHGLAQPGAYEDELRIHLAFNSWMAEGQWHTFRPSELGLVENERTSWSEASASNVGSWSTGKYLPMVVVENVKENLTWFWQIEHNGSWHWEISNSSEHSNVAEDMYAYLGGPDDLHSDAWKQLPVAHTYETVPVALGCVAGGFDEAVEQLTLYRRSILQTSSRLSTRKCAVIFNDYMNCLWGDPTEAKELPLIEAAAKAGCEYYVIDAGWYAGLHEDWSQTLGAWLPSPERWPQGIRFTLDAIKKAGMVPGLWLEPEVAGIRSGLAATAPDSWFFQRHGRRVLRNSRYILDFRNPEVVNYLARVVQRLVSDYGIGYIKLDYNVNSLAGTDLRADSPGQGLLEHNRAVLGWLERIVRENRNLVVENCGSGGGRMDYAMLSRLHIQSMTDQEDYRRLPAILAGVSAAVLPEQIGVWSYPLVESDADQASFNMVTSLTARVHQSGRLDVLSRVAFAQVQKAIAVYKREIRPYLPQTIPFYPLGMPDMHEKHKPVVLGMRSSQRTFVSVWRLEGSEICEIPIHAQDVVILYPSDLGITVEYTPQGLRVRFPRPYMACMLLLT